MHHIISYLMKKLGQSQNGGNHGDGHHYLKKHSTLQWYTLIYFCYFIFMILYVLGSKDIRVFFIKID